MEVAGFEKEDEYNDKYELKKKSEIHGSAVLILIPAVS